MEFDIRELAYCGLYCPQCSFRAANETGSREHFADAPERYAQLTQKPLEELACPGCKGDNICGDCAMKDCAVEKGLEVCADCDEFPCDKLTAFGGDGAPHHAGALEALHAIRELGREAFFESIRPDLACATCGKRQSWYFRCEHER